MYDEASDFQHHRSEIDAALALLQSIGTPLRRDMVALDLGAGQGMHAGLLANVVGKVHCADIIDYSSLYGGEFLKLLKEKHERHGYAFPLERVAFHQADATDLHFRDAFFDAVISINSFEHIPDPRKALWETIRTTKPGGLIFVSTDPIWTADTGSHFFHRVPEPWGHLVYSDDEFIAKMKTNGAPPEEIGEFKSAMNRWRAASYQIAVDDVVQRGLVKLAHRDSWSGVVDEAHRSSDNLTRLKARDFSEEELLVRGLRWVLIKQ
jgi:ubiquinone/menaquinone biosynthesis C-methylase UbiE